MTYSRAFFGVAEDADFDLDAASRAYDWVMAHYEIAPFVVSKALLDHTAADLELHRDEVRRVVAGYMASRTEALKQGMVRELITKSAAGESVDTMARAAEVVALIAKAEYTPWERERNAEKQLRDAGGRFRVMNRRIVAGGDQPLGSGPGRQLKIPNVKDVVSDPRQRAAYQSAYLQVRDALKTLDYSGMAEDIFVRGIYDDGSSTKAMPLSQALREHGDTTTGENGLVNASAYGQGKRLTRLTADAYTGADASTPAQAFDVMTGMAAAPGFAMYATGAGSRAGRAVDELADPTTGWNAADPNDVATNERFWRRTTAAAQLAETLGGPALPAKAKLALKTAQWAGEHAPQAEEVLGPTARKAAYRYRGVEKAPDPIFQRVINDARRQFGSGRDAHDFLIQGRYLATPKGKGRPGQGVWEDKQPSPLIEAMRRRLPDPQLYELNRRAGTIPPSQGIIIDRNGKVVTEAMGYGDDWYLPFNLKNMNRLRGGEYVRTRAYGGPTTEDIYAGMVSGARGLTVVSHSGVFHVEFDDTFRGNRRYNDKAARMVKRYGMLLDAVQSQKVTLGEVPPDKKAELRQRAAEDWDPTENRREYEARYEQLLSAEKTSPSLSTRRTNELKQGVLDEWARDHDAADFSTWMVREHELQVKRAVHAGFDPAEADGMASAAMQEKYSPDDLDVPLESLGLKSKADRLVDAAQTEYRNSMNPLQLDGEGYKKALDALRDQFPYYFADPYYEPLPSKTDKGYIKPRFNRPAGALAGYYDPSITGKGKFTADQLNYQNMAARGNRKIKFQEVQTDPEAKENSDAAGPREGGKGHPERAKDAELMAVVRMVRTAKANPDAPGNDARMKQWLAEHDNQYGEQAMSQLRAMAPLVYDPDIERKMAADPTVRTKLGEQLDRLRATDKLAFDTDIWNAFKDAGGTAKADSLPLNPDGSIDGGAMASSFGKVYDFASARPGKTPEAYATALAETLRKPGVKEAFAALPELEAPKAGASAEEVLEALDAAVGPIKAQYAEYAKRDAGLRGRPTVPLSSLDRQIHGLSEALALAKAQQKATKAAAPPPAPESPAVAVHFHEGEGGSLTEMMEAVLRGAPYDPSRDPNLRSGAVPGEVIKPRSLGT